MKRILLSFTLLLLCMTGAWAYDFEVGGIYYNTISGTQNVEVTSGDAEYSGSVVIPESVTYNGTTYSVTSIGDWAFVCCSGLTSVTIPNSVTSIGERAFEGCSGLTSVTIPNSVTSIGERAFDGCSGLTSVEWNAKKCADFEYDYYGKYSPFKYCTSITTFTFGNEVEHIPAYLCSGLSGLTSVTIPNSVTSIGERAFEGCSGLTSVTIPNSVTSIGERAFYGCSGLTSVTIPNSVTSIGVSAFGDCSGLTSVTIPNSVTSIGDYAFYGCSGLTSVTIPNSVTSIGDYAFEGCSGLTSVTIPNSVTSIGDYAFDGCSGLTSVTIGNSVTSIGEFAFRGCSGLTSVTIPNSVTYIGYVAFEGCSGLTSVEWNVKKCADFEYDYGPFKYCTSITTFTFGNEVEHIPAYFCSGLSGLTSVTIGNSVTSIGERAFYGCSGLTSVEWNAKKCADFDYDSYGVYGPFKYCTSITTFTFGNEVEHIPAYLCSGLSGLTSVTIPNSVTSIGESAFGGCSDLTSVTIGNSVTYIGYEAFYGCSGLTSVEWNAKKCADFEYDYYGKYSPFKYCTSITTFTFGNEVEHIPAYLCYGLSGLTSVTIPNSVTYIGYEAFWGCSGLTSVTIPNSVTYVGDWAFYGTKIRTLVYNENVFAYMPAFYEGEYTVPDGIKSVAGGAFYGCSGLTSVTIPNSVTSIGVSAFWGCSGLTSVTIPNSVTSIGVSAFGGCSGLTSVTIGNSVTSIGEFAFGDCSGLTSVTIPNSVTSIGDYAFYGCSGLTSVTIPNSVTYIGHEAFYGCSGLTSVTIPNSVTYVGDWAFNGCSGLTAPVYNNNVFAYMPESYQGSYSIPDGIKSVAGGAFEDCSGLTSVTIPNSVTYVGDWAFEGCSGLKSVYVYATEPPVLEYGILDEDRIMNVKFYVPEASEAAYTSAEVWKEYFIFPMSELEMFKVTVSSNDEAMGTVSGGGEYHKGATVTLTATANTGYKFVKWSDGNTNATRELTVTENVELEATFAAIEYTVNVTSADETMGTVTVEGEAPYTYGEKVTLKATAKTGYAFVKWSDDNTNATRELTVTANVELTATFAAIEYTVNVTSANTEMGTVTVEGEAPYTYGEKVTLKATANAGYEFVKWSDENTNATRELIITSDTTLTATFAAIIEPATPVVTIDNAVVTVDGTFLAGADVEAKFTVKAADLTADITFEAAGVTFTPATIAKDNAALATGVEVTAAFKAVATKGENTVTITVKSEGAETKTVIVKYTVTEETGVENVTVTSTVWSESGMLFIEAAAETQATVYTLQGQVVETLNLTQGVNTVALPSATYIVKVGETAVKVSVR